MKEAIIKVINIKKRYTLGSFGYGTLAKDFQSFWAKVTKKNDPNTAIGVENDIEKRIFWALKGVDFEINKGETVAILGTNGAGKSTLLKLICRITSPTDGEIQIAGKLTSMLEVGTGFHPDMTGRENIYINGAILGMKKEDVDKHMEEIIEFSECRDFIDTPVKRYSSGMYIKLGFAVAAILDSDIIIMDEVLAVGDLRFQNKCIKKMRDLAKDEGKTVIYVSHNMSTVRGLCTRAIVLDKGRIIFDGDIEEGIDIYSQNIGSTSSVTDVSKMERSSTVTNQARITNIAISNMPLVQGSKARFKVDIFSDKDIPNAEIKVNFNTLEGGCLGYTTSDKLISLAANKSNCVEFELSTDLLLDGYYIIDLTLFKTKDDLIEIIDEVSNAFTFEVTEKIKDTSMKSKLKSGKIKFPKIRID